MLENYSTKFEFKGKFIFVPNVESVRKGEKLLRFFERSVDFPQCFFHYRKGGHVAALHNHLSNRFFFRIDLKNFFYSIGRKRVGAALHAVGFANFRTYAKWSCVKNPFGQPAYALPIGFVQSSALASLVLSRSLIMMAVEAAAAQGVFVSVYLDDLIGSAREIESLQRVYAAILEACAQDNLLPNEAKLVLPSESIVAFNCELRHGFVEVTEERASKFFATERSGYAVAAFDAYRRKVAERNVAA